MELTVNTMQGKTASNKKGPGQNRLKNFNIPKRTLDKVILTECFANKREYGEVKQCLIQGCLATEDNFENLWPIEKIEMVQNKHLEEEFVMKRSRLRQERKPDKELQCFLVVSKDDVSKICQSGLHIGQQRKIMNEIGNRHLGVYLFKHVDIALKYAASCSLPVENVIIFRVLLGKVKKIPPAKGNRKMALDPTPNYDCHMSTVQSSLKDLLENQALGSLVYFYEYNEFAKPVDRPRQCLPYAVVKVKCVTPKMGASFTFKSLKGRPKRLPQRVERDHPLENCTRVTRIGKSQLIYEHFRNPTERCTAKHNFSTRWDKATNELTIQKMPEMNASIDIRSDHIENEKPLEMHIGVSPGSGLSIVTTSKSIKDPRLARRQQILEKQNGEAASHESSQCEKKLDCNLEMQMSAALDIPYILPATSLLYDSNLVSGQRQYIEKTTWKEYTSEECLPSPLLSHEQWLGNIEKEILGCHNTYSSLALGTYLDNHSFKSKDSKHSVTVMEGNLQEQKEMQHSELFSSKLNPYKTVGNVWIPQDSQPNNKEHEFIIEPFFNYDDNDKYMCRKNPEDIISSKDEIGGREVRSWLCDDDEDNDNDDNYTSEKHCSAALDTEYFMNNCTSSEGEHSIEFCNIQDITLQSGFCEKNPVFENTLRKVCTEDQYIWERSLVEMSAEYLEQNEFEAVQQSEKSSIPEVHKKMEQIDSVSETAKPTVAEKKEHIVKDLKESSVEERIGSTDYTGFSNADPEMFDTTCFCRENIPEICEQALEIKYKDAQDFKIICEMDDALKEYKKCLSESPKSCDHKNLADEEGKYNYLQKRMDWDNANTKVPGNPSGNENVNEEKPGEKFVVEENETDSFNTFVYPDLEITVTTLFQSKLKKEIGKCTSKYSGPKKSIKSFQDKTLEKCTEVQKNVKPYHTKEECSSAIFSSLSKGKLKKKQSEKHIKNILTILNREVLLCKNKSLSKKIAVALFHLRKAQRRVQSLKIGAKTRKRKSNVSLSQINKIVHNESLPSGSFATSGCLSDMPCRSDKVTNATITEVEVASDTSAPNNTSSNSSSNQCTLSDEQSSVNFTSRNIVKDKMTILAEDAKQNLSFEENLCATQNTASHLNPTVVGNELVCHVDKNKVDVISNRNVDIVSFATTAHAVLESSAKEDVFNPGDTSMLSPNFLMLENVSDEKRIMEMCPVEENKYTSIRAERYFLSPTERKHDASLYQVQLTPQMHDVGFVHLNARSNDSSERLVESFTGQKQEALFHRENMFLKPEDSCLSELSRKVEWEFWAAEYNKCRKSDIMTKSVNQPENNFEVVSPRGYLESPVSLEDNKLSHSSPNYAFQGCEDVGIAFLETEEHFSDTKQCVINDILVKPLMNMSLDQQYLTHTTHGTSCQEMTCSQPSTNLLVRTFSDEHVEPITATSPSASACYGVITTKAKQNFTPMTRPHQNSISVGLSNNNTNLSSDFMCAQMKTELTSSDFQIKIPEILQKADETSSLTLLHEQIMFCKRILPVFIEAFQEKQGCSFEHVLVSREILGSAGGSLQPSCKLDPCAIESLVELQIVMETIEFIENKKKLLEREPTFRSLLWYDNSLCTELFGGQTGYQQQSNFYPTFQRRLKYSPLHELQSYHKQLVDVFENTRWENYSYYTLLKSRREIEECEAAMKTNSDYSDFFLSVPYICGANYGDTLEDLEETRKNAMQLINVYKDLPGIHLSAEKDFHLWLIMDITATKLEFIRTCEGVNIKSSLFGLEHIYFDTAKSLVWKEKSINGNLKDGQMLNIFSVSKFYETYENMIQQITEQAVQQSRIQEKKAGQQNANNCIANSFILPNNICYIGEILDEAQSADIERLEQLMCQCTEHMEMLQKYFQILQEEDISVLITKENVLGFMKSGGIKPVILKPEATEIYIEMTMVYETVVYLQNSIARKVNKPTFRSLLWIDLSLLPEIFQGQEKMASFSYRKGNILKQIESSISEIEEELNVIYDYSGNLNCPYALHLLTRELTELSKTRNLLKKSKSSIARCVDLAPYSISLNYGSTVYELECNYNQFSSLLEKLMLAERKDLGKIAHVMKIMKTIENMKFVCSEQGKSPLPVVIHQMLKNWRKACQFKRLDMKTNLADGEGQSTKHNFQHSQAWNERPANVTLESNLRSSEENNGFPQSKKKKKQ